MIKALTDMHVGSGDTNYNIVENQVQRDVVTEFPTINASSLKGAIRSHFGYEKYSEVFGTDSTKGRYKFFSAKLLSYPVRSNHKPFYRATCPQVIRELLGWMETFDIEPERRKILEKVCKDFASLNELIIFDDAEVIIEDYKVKLLEKYSNYAHRRKLEEWFGENLVIFPDDKFKKIVKELPVIARNNLENGISKNLWYEEIIPRETRFYFITMVDKDNCNKDFEKNLNDEVIQIGGNATIGYGYTKFKMIDGGNND